MKSHRPWLPGAIKAYRALKEEHLREATASRLAADQARQALEDSGTELARFCRAWVQQRETLHAPHELEQAYQQFHAHLRQQQAAASEHHRAMEAQLTRAQDQLRTSRGKHRVLERLEDIGKQQGAQQQRKLELQQTAESWCLGQYGKGSTE